MNKVQLNKKLKVKLDATRAKVLALQEKQEKLVTSLAKELKIKEGTEHYEILWDHIFNGSDWCITFTE